MKFRPTSGTSGVQHSVALWLLVLLFAPYAVPAGSILFSSSEATKDCCPTKDHGCCRRDRAAGVGLQLDAVVKCPRRCAAAAGFTLQSFLPTADSQLSMAGPAPAFHVAAVERTGGFASSYLAFLYQRPPPSQ